LTTVSSHFPSRVAASICVPVYNASLRIRQTLEATERAIAVLPNPADVELIIIDNGSSDDTRGAVDKFWQASVMPYAKRYVVESKSGAPYARMRGWQEARGQVIVFCDDDVTIGADGLRLILHTAESETSLGGGGGKIIPQLEDGVAWPTWFDDRLRANLAISDDASAVSYNPPSSYLPVSALVWFRREALQKWTEYLTDDSVFPLGPKGKEMWRGDDIEMDLFVARAGWAFKFDPAIVGFHRIATGRLSVDYMLSLLYWNGRSGMRIQHRWHNVSWFYCASRVLYRGLWKEPMRVLRALSGRGKQPAERFRIDPQSLDSEVNAQMHYAYYVGTFDEMVAKAVNPWRF